MEAMHIVIESHCFNHDAMSYIGILSSILLLGRFAKKRINSYIYDQDHVYNIKRIRKAPYIKHSDRNIKLKNELSGMNNIVNRLKDTVDENKLDSFYNNLGSLRIIDNNKRINKIMNKRRTAAEYVYKTNTIRINSDVKHNALSHESLHLASCVQGNSHRFSGFEQNTKPFLFHKFRVGLGLNEGYTELLNERIFGNDMVSAYHYLMYVVEQLEEIVGKDAMETFYFKADLKGLINELQNYGSMDIIMELLHMTDTFYYCLLNNTLIDYLLSDCVITINNCLLDLKTNKEYHDYIEGNISEEDMNKDIEEFKTKSRTSRGIRNNFLYVINDYNKKYVYKQKNLA